MEVDKLREGSSKGKDEKAGISNTIYEVILFNLQYSGIGELPARIEPTKLRKAGGMGRWRMGSIEWIGGKAWVTRLRYHIAGINLLGQFVFTLEYSGIRRITSGYFKPTYIEEVNWRLKNDCGIKRKRERGRKREGGSERERDRGEKRRRDRQKKRERER